MKALILVADGFRRLGAVLPLVSAPGGRRGRDARHADRPAGDRQARLRGRGRHADPRSQPGRIRTAADPRRPIAGGACGCGKRRWTWPGRLSRKRSGSRPSATARSCCSAPAPLNGRTITCAPTIRDDVRAAGATYRDEAVVVDGNVVTSRGPDDLPEFCRQLVAMIHARA